MVAVSGLTPWGGNIGIAHGKSAPRLKQVGNADPIRRAAAPSS